MGTALLAACGSGRPAEIDGSAEANAEGADWPSYGGGPNADHYSPLSQINAANVARLGLAWYYDIDTGPNAFTAPIAVDGVLYFAAGFSIVHALDARTGKLLWSHDPEAWKVAGRKMRSAWGIRGIAYARGRIFTGTVDGRLIALDAKSGKPLWSVQTLDQDASYITGPPWIAGDKVVIGFGGADFGPVRGYVTAYYIDSGKQAWRFYTVPGNPALGFENKTMEMAAKTWTGQWWKYGGGGTAWNAMAYDRALNRIYVGTGNGSPWNRKIRSPGGGDNLFLCSIIALDADSGEYIWHYQVNPGETWDYNAAMDIELADLEIEGRSRGVILHAPKNGFFYVIDRTNGKLISAEKFVPANWAERIDSKSGRPVENPEARYPGGKPAIVYPSPVGGHNVEAMSFSPRTRLVYLPAFEQARVYIDPPGDLKAWRYAEGQVLNPGTGIAPESIRLPQPTSHLLAWDPIRQKAVWKIPQTGPRNGGTMSTAGNLVFQGQVTGEFAAYAADSGKKLWSFYAQNGIMAQPISYSVGGRQYVTVIASWRSSGPSGHSPEWDYHAQQRRVLTFALNGNAKLPPANSSEASIADDPGFRVEPAKAATGEMLFAQRCAICHGPAAVSGGSAPDLRKAGTPLEPDAFSTVLKEGLLQERGMPRFEELSTAQIDGLRHYIRKQARLTLASPDREKAAAEAARKASKLNPDQ